MKKMMYISVACGFLLCTKMSFAAYISVADQRLLVAVKQGNVRHVQMLLEGGANVNAMNNNGNTALMLASSSGYADIVSLLIEAGADINIKAKDGHRALDFAPNGQIKKMLHDDINRNLLRAASQGDIKAVQNALAANADVNAQDRCGFTALIFAAANGRTDIVDLLIARRADVDAQVKDNHWTALMYAAAAGHVEVVLLLLDRGADINAKSKNGSTARDFINKKWPTRTVFFA